MEPEAAGPQTAAEAEAQVTSLHLSTHHHVLNCRRNVFHPSRFLVLAGGQYHELAKAETCLEHSHP